MQSRWSPRTLTAWKQICGDAIPCSTVSPGSNRRQADDVPHKLAELRWSVEPAPLPDPDHEPPKLTSHEVERLAEAEHGRWASDQRASPNHRSLVPWSELGEDEREKDRDTIRDLPERLAALGFRVVPTSGA